MNKARVLAILMSALLLLSLFCMPASAYAVDDGAEKSYAAATEAMVLLKNENSALPLTASDKIAIFGEGQVYTDGKTGGFFLMGRGSGYFVPSETPKSPYEVLASYADEGKLGGVYTALSSSYQAAADTAEAETDFAYSPTDAEYTAAAEYADKAIYILNRTSFEAADNTQDTFTLTSAEQEELQKVCAAFNGKPVIVVLNSGGVIGCGFANGRVDGIYADALLTAPYLGIRGVQALCDVLVGDVNPSGKTVDTYAKEITDYPSYVGFNESRAYWNYYEDIYVGYRYFETFHVDVDYPFGYGLSYTDFDISDIAYSETATEITVTAKVTNTGDVAGKEVVQVYFGAPQKGTGAAVLSKASKELAGFAKTSLLAPGASETVTVSYPIDTMASYDDLGTTGHKSAYVMEAGDYTVYVGNSVRNTAIAGTHTESELRVTEQLSELCEPTTAFERMTFDGTETVGENSAFRADLLHTPTADKRVYKAEPIQFSEVLRGSVTMETFLSQMTNDELCDITVMTHAAATNTKAWGGSVDMVEKYGIPTADSCDGPAGIRITTKGTGLPCATALACTWNTDVVGALGDVIGRECVLSSVDVWLAPGVNIHRYPLCGRNFEYYSEDPYIAGVMASEIIRGVEAYGIATSVKHFVANEKETNRDSMSANMSERALREIVLVPFKMAVEAGVSTVMTSYNYLNGTETSENAELLRGILRGEWGFEGMITTDWSNNSKLVNEIIAGNNVKSSGYVDRLDPTPLKEAVREGTVSRSLLIENATYVMNLLAKLPDGDRLTDDSLVHTVAADGATTFEAEDFTHKHGYARPEITSSRTFMAYVRGTADWIPYLTYTLDVEKAGSYILTASMANNSSDPNADALRVYVNGVEQYTSYNAISTGGWAKMETREVGRVDLPAGRITLKIKSAENRACGNFDTFTLTPIEEVYTAINTADELLALMGNTDGWSGKYYLTTDIDLTDKEGQGPIGTNATNFTGVFDGMGYSIKGISLSTSTEKDFALFGKIKNAVIRDLTVYGTVESTYANAVVGGIVGTADPGAFVVGCVNYADVTYTNTAKAAKGVGGVAGYLYAGGTNTGTVIKQCVNHGTVTSNSGGYDAVAGGVVGIMNDNGTGVCEVQQCENYGTVYGDGIKVGGIAGYIAQAAAGGGAVLEHCVNYGDISAAKGRMGGVTGYIYSLSVTDGKEPQISYCVNKGNVQAGVGYESGGIAGFNAGANIHGCVNLGTVTATDGGDFGGIVGKTYTTTNTIVFEITDCYTTVYSVIPTASYEKPEYFAFTNCGVASQADIENGNTTLTYGENGYIMTAKGLSLAALQSRERFPLGDRNADGHMDLADAILALRAYLDGSAPMNVWNADLNDDGKNSLLDILITLKLIVE